MRWMKSKKEPLVMLVIAVAATAFIFFFITTIADLTCGGC